MSVLLIVKNMILRAKKYILLILFFIFIVLFISIIGQLAYAIFSKNVTQKQCIDLKNGLYLGYNAVFDFRRVNGWPDILARPFVVPKYSDGTPLVDQSLYTLYITDTSVYGHTWGEPTGPVFHFAWRADVGVVRSDQDRETYRRIVDEAGPANHGIGQGGYGASIVLERMAELPDYSYQWCPTRLIVW